MVSFTEVLALGARIRVPTRPVPPDNRAAKPLPPLARLPHTWAEARREAGAPHATARSMGRFWEAMLRLFF